MSACIQRVLSASVDCAHAPRKEQAEAHVHGRAVSKEQRKAAVGAEGV